MEGNDPIQDCERTNRQQPSSYSQHTDQQKARYYYLDIYIKT
jgi:hypothetical protein